LGYRLQDASNTNWVATEQTTGVFVANDSAATNKRGVTYNEYTYTGPQGLLFDSNRVVPSAAKNQPRAWGSLACVYLGLPAS
jgi:hypothetical protein